VLFAALLRQHGQRGPAEIAPKRDWTYRQVSWLARQHGITFQLPVAHPFNPLPLLRLAVACASDGLPNRFTTEAVFRHAWCGGLDAEDPQRLQVLTEQLAPVRDPAGADVKAQLRAWTDEAVALGLFGVPTLVVDGKAFWGLDALPMVRDYLAGDAWFSGPDWGAAATVPVGRHRSG
jgi:2-hydroxychromene-2-carboxylate isomerase